MWKIIVWKYGSKKWTFLFSTMSSTLGEWHILVVPAWNTSGSCWQGLWSRYKGRSCNSRFVRPVPTGLGLLNWSAIIHGGRYDCRKRYRHGSNQYDEYSCRFLFEPCKKRQALDLDLKQIYPLPLYIFAHGYFFVYTFIHEKVLKRTSRRSQILNIWQKLNLNIQIY